MKVLKTNLEGLFLIQSNVFKDQRGIFVKTFHKEIFKENGLETDFRESFFSISKKNVIRGMHFQLPPDEHVKLVYCVYGKVLDVVVDIRNNSPTYGDPFLLSLQKIMEIYCIYQKDLLMEC